MDRMTKENFNKVIERSNLETDRARSAFNFHIEGLLESKAPWRSIYKEFINEIMIQYPMVLLRVVDDHPQKEKLREVLDNTIKAALSRARRIHGR